MVTLKQWIRIAFWGSLLILGLFSCKPSQPLRTDWDRLNLRGRVQLYEEWSYGSYDAFKVNNFNRHTVTRFTPQGQVQKEGYYTNKPGYMYWRTFTYTPGRVWIKEILEINSSNPQPQQYWEYELDDRGEQRVVRSFLIDSSLNYQIEFELNSDYLPTAIEYSEVRSPQLHPCKILRTYDEQKRLATEEIYVYNTDMNQCYDKPSRSKFTYNEEGDVQREILNLYTGGSPQYLSYQYLYDSVGNWTQRLTYTGDDVTSVTKRSFLYH